MLLLDASGNVEGWEHDFSGRLFQVLGRKNIGLASDAPIRVRCPEEMGPHVAERDFNCILLFGHGAAVPEETRVRRFWTSLSEHDLSPKLLAVCTCEDDDPETSREVLEARGSFAKLAVVPLSPLSRRVAWLFFMKFFAELDLHSEAEGTVTGKMVWFSHAKAKVLLERRHYPGELEVRC